MVPTQIGDPNGIMGVRSLNFKSLNTFCLQSVLHSLLKRLPWRGVGRRPPWRRHFFSNGIELREAGDVTGHRVVRHSAGMVAARLLLGSTTPAHERKEDPVHEHRAAGDGAGRVLEAHEVKDGVTIGSKCHGARRVVSPISDAI
jgi:hypothetical protein